jgi:hypothetical protein
MQNKRSPRLVLVGSAIATAGLLNACDKPAAHTTRVLRNGYATQQACLDDWGPQDCTYIDAAAAGDPASSTNSSASARSSTSAGGGSGGSGGHGGGYWYGPYYTRQGVVYHESGSTSTRSEPPAVRAGTTTELNVRESELQRGSDAFFRNPSAEAAHEARVTSRGGFLHESPSLRAAGRFFSGFHGFHGSGGG